MLALVSVISEISKDYFISTEPNYFEIFDFYDSIKKLIIDKKIILK